MSNLDYTYTWYTANNLDDALGGAPKNADIYMLVVAVDDNDYVGSLEIPFEISKQAVSAKPKNEEISFGNSIQTFNTVLTVQGKASEETIMATVNLDHIVVSRNVVITDKDEDLNQNVAVGGLDDTDLLAGEDEYGNPVANASLTVSLKGVKQASPIKTALQSVISSSKSQNLASFNMSVFADGDEEHKN